MNNHQAFNFFMICYFCVFEVDFGEFLNSCWHALLSTSHRINFSTNTLFLCQGKKVKCSASQAKHRLFIGNVPRNWGEADMKKAVTEIGPGVISVELLKVCDFLLLLFFFF